MTLDELIAALEKAEGPDRYLDAKIGEALGWRVSSDNWWNVRKCGCSVPLGDEWCIRKDGRKDIPCEEALPHFTSSIDAAMTLVPKGWLLSEFGQNHPEFKSVADREWFAGVMGPVSWAPPEPGAPDEPVYDHANGTHDIPAIALCIAALRARKEGDGNENAS